ncbi:MAG: hypothetical protein ACTHLE_05635 [Agriterribacter sp.]
MKQMTVPEELLIPIDYDAPETPPEVKQFRPVLFQREEVFHCVLGTDEATGIAATGATEDEAIAQWLSAFKERLKNGNDQDELLIYIRDTMAAGNLHVW